MPGKFSQKCEIIIQFKMKKVIGGYNKSSKKSDIKQRVIAAQRRLNKFLIRVYETEMISNTSCSLVLVKEFI